MRIPKHIGIIPDGNRRWALENGMEKERGYENGIAPGRQMYHLCRELGVEELTFYGFTADNTKRPSRQRIAFTRACEDAVEALSSEDASLLVVGNQKSSMFPGTLQKYTVRQTFGKGGIKVNFLVNYSWEWDLGWQDKTGERTLHSREISRIDLVIRWGGRRRLSGFLPVQSVYADIYVVEEYWPDFRKEQVEKAIQWYSRQDVTLGG